MPPTTSQNPITAIRARRWLHVSAILLFGIIFIIIHLRLHQYGFDDAFIHFRVARNLFETGKPYFNINEAVKVSTSSAWVILLTILISVLHFFRLENNLPMLVAAINALATLGGSIIYARIISRVTGRQQPAPMILWFCISYWALTLPSSIGLMETPLALLMAGLGIYALLLSRSEGFILLSIAVYLRLELATSLVLCMIVGLKSMRLRDIIVFSTLGFAPFFFYDLYSFQTFIPQSIVAKSTVYLTTWDQTAANILFSSLPVVLEPKNNAYLIGAGVLFLSILLFTGESAFRMMKWSGNFWAFVFWIWGILVVAGYILGHALMFDWYTPLYLVPMITAFFLCANIIPDSQSFFVRSTLYLLSFMAIISLTQTISASIYNPNVYSRFSAGSRLKTYLEVGKVLYEEYPDATLLSSEIGGLGYSFHGRVLDAVGLASPEALAFHPTKEPGSIPPAYVKEIMPEIMISYDIFAQALLQDEVVEQYKTIQIPVFRSSDSLHAEDAEVFGSKYLRIYLRKDLLLSRKLIELENQ